MKSFKSFTELWEIIEGSVENYSKILIRSRIEPEEILELVEEMTGGKELFLIYGRTAFEMLGKKLEERLILKNRPYIGLEISKELSAKMLDDIIEHVENRQIGAVIGMGGGFTIDIAKYIGSRLGSKVIIIPTTLSTNALISPFSVLKLNDKPEALRTGSPDMLIADLEILSKTPKRHLAAGFADSLAKYTALFDWQLARWFSEELFDLEAYRLGVVATKTLIEVSRNIALNPTSFDSIKELLYSLLIDGYLIAKANTTRAVAGSEHLIALALSLLSEKTLHGENVSLGIIISSYIQRRNWNLMRRILKGVGAPTHVSETDLEEEILIEALMMAPQMRKWHTVLGRFNKERIREFLNACKVI